MPSSTVHTDCAARASPPRTGSYTSCYFCHNLVNRDRLVCTACAVEFELCEVCMDSMHDGYRTRFWHLVIIRDEFLPGALDFQVALAFEAVVAELKLNNELFVLRPAHGHCNTHVAVVWTKSDMALERLRILPGVASISPFQTPTKIALQRFARAGLKAIAEVGGLVGA